MATVAISVEGFKRLFGIMERALETVLSHDASVDVMGDLLERYDLPYPDWVCNHCGFTNEDGDFEGKDCPRCGKNPVR